MSKQKIEKVQNLMSGDWVDLGGDKYAYQMASNTTKTILEMEYAVVDSVVRETGECVCVYFQDDLFSEPVRFPLNHKVKVKTNE
tara:strand:+ start:281 stop:532 length:252 start_codon:yes stop_codon:yes gene_type:complete